MRKIILILILICTLMTALVGCSTDATSSAAASTSSAELFSSTAPETSSPPAATLEESSSQAESAATEQRFTVTGIDVAGLMGTMSSRKTITLIGVLDDGTEVFSSGDPKTWFSGAAITDLLMPKDTPVTMESKDNGLWHQFLVEKGKHIEATVLYDGISYSLKITDGLSFFCTVEDNIATLVFDPALCDK